MMLSSAVNIKSILSLAQRAGDEILAIYQDESLAHKHEVKGDGSPLTLADTASHDCIVAGLRELTPDIPVLSEENAQAISYAQRKQWNRFWLVDPLDGTKEFLKRNGEFTVNIALIEDNRPVMGVIYVPCTAVSYYALSQGGAFKVEGGQRRSLPLSTDRPNDHLVVVVSGSHLNQATADYLQTLEASSAKLMSKLSVGSSLKFCLVAEGLADIYPRLAPTMEWDTAAADIIVHEAGGRVVREHSQEPLLYNKENLLNPGFIVT
jgi:3'(2'), 5'-bisphosphate nucleotidase